MSTQARKSKVSLSQRRPVLTVVIIELLLLLAVFAAGAYATINEITSYTSPVLISFIPIALVLIIYFTVKNKWTALGFRSLRSISAGEWKYFIPLILVLITVSLKGFQSISLSKVLFFIGFTLLVGFVEESIYRGLILKTLLPKGIKTAVITSSLLFSVTHLLNAISGQNLTQTLLQLVYALLVGGVLALLMVRNNNIIPLILFHFIHNLIQFVGNDNTSAYLGYDIFILVILAAQCVWLALSLRNTATPAKLSKAS
ncbi:CPBP family intramembrane glutamic endopeptidase [Paenibacillus sp. sgz500958]|uniref:CPBP family intramembrane glutamic endopeptidase n=1 Tax=Paenibacillus sp. sgz500958 TaxID=3242475 RepID=UPI0036D36768